MKMKGQCVAERQKNMRRTESFPILEKLSGLSSQVRLSPTKGFSSISAKAAWVSSTNPAQKAHRSLKNSISFLSSFNNVAEVVMQKLNFVVYVVIGLALCFSSCKPTVDVEKEKSAIRAVIEAEKQGYFDKSLERMAATWVQKSSSVKMFMSQKGEVDLFGWARISERSKEEIAAIDSNYTNIDLQFSDFQFNIYEGSAWAIFKA
jgi:hypothetical protein